MKNDDVSPRLKLDKARVHAHDIVTGMFVREMLARNVSQHRMERIRTKNMKNPMMKPREDDDTRYPYEEEVWLFFLGLDMSLGEEYNNPVSYYSSKNMKHESYRNGIKVGEHIKDGIAEKKIELEVANKLRRSGETFK